MPNALAISLAIARCSRYSSMLSLQLIERDDCQDKTIYEIADKYPPPGWIRLFEEAKPELRLVSNILAKLGRYFPLNRDVFRAFDLTPLPEVKVVILGQDPYHSVENGMPQANGLAFSTRRGCPVQPSLKNIYQELEREYPVDEPTHKKFVAPNHGDLTKWADQGVLLLNTCLTVAPHLPGSHKEIWNGFVTKVIEAISAYNPRCVYMLWGKKAIDFADYRLGQGAIKLYASHPSPHSANKPSRDAPAFIGCGHFRLANTHLVQLGHTPIDWTLD